MQNTGLNSRAHGNNFIRINTFVWLFAKEFGHFLNHFWHTGHAANQNDFVDITRGQAGIFQCSLARLQGGFDEITHQAFQFGPCKFHDQVQGLTRCAVHRDEGLIDFCLAGRGQFNFCLFSRFFQPLQSHFIFGQINAIFLLELFRKVVDDAHVKVFTAKERVPIGGFDFKQTVVDFQDGDIECPTTKVIDGNDLRFFFVQTIGQSRCGWLVDDPQDFKAGNLTGIFRRLTLRVIKIGRHSDDRL